MFLRLDEDTVVGSIRDLREEAPLDELSVDIEDRDQIEGSYFINVTPNKGFFSKLLSTASITKTYQLILKEDANSQSRVIFVDLSEENDEKTISYSAELFDQIASKF